MRENKTSTDWRTWQSLVEVRHLQRTLLTKKFKANETKLNHKKVCKAQVGKLLQLVVDKSIPIQWINLQQLQNYIARRDISRVDWRSRTTESVAGFTCRLILANTGNVEMFTWNRNYLMCSLSAIDSILYPALQKRPCITMTCNPQRKYWWSSH